MLLCVMIKHSSTQGACLPNATEKQKQEISISKGLWVVLRVVTRSKKAESSGDEHALMSTRSRRPRNSTRRHNSRASHRVPTTHRRITPTQFCIQIIIIHKVGIKKIVGSSQLFTCRALFGVSAVAGHKHGPTNISDPTPLALRSRPPPFPFQCK